MNMTNYEILKMLELSCPIIEVREIPTHLKGAAKSTENGVHIIFYGVSETKNISKEEFNKNYAVIGSFRQ